MKRLAAFMLLALAASAQASADNHQHTTQPTDARYEIVQSELAAKWTFRLDRFTGHVLQLVRTTEGYNAWEDLKVIGLPPVVTTKARFQIFTSGLAARHTFLIDAATGKTWTLTSKTRSQDDGTQVEIMVWQPFSGE